MFLNLDAGELDSETDALWSLFDVLNCACGGHAGDAHSMTRVATFCARPEASGTPGPVRLGAHPSYPDREHFGRRSVPMPPADLAASVEAQCRVLADTARAAGVDVWSVKPHGALYHDVAATRELAEAFVDAATAALGRDVTIIGPPDGAIREAARQLGLRYAREGFADRRMRSDGSLVPRTESDALIANPEEAISQALSLASRVDTISVHADSPGALEIARALRRTFRG